ncbi:MAG: TIGR00282 family metallophosphoesterase [Selenomonadaceae bacterium]|nr:TIGR00282 family metallophosphoesterase [Selenomonadaceae bacterium]
MRILMVGDIFGRAGRKFFCERTKELKREKNIDVVVVNGENVAHGKSLSPSTFTEITSGGADIITTGNHVWDRKDVIELLEREPFLIRPANYPENSPGKSFCIYPYRAKNIGVINLLGRTFMAPIDNPFISAEEILKKIKRECDIILVDFHAEATSEKLAMGYFLDGKVTAVVGTHTHVQTADERILPNGTAYITDLGMVGSLNSIIGMQIEPVIEKYLTCRPAKFEVAENFPCMYCAVIIDIDDKNNLPTSIERVNFLSA